MRSQDTSFDIQNQLADGEQVISAGVTASHILEVEEIKDEDGNAIARSRAIEATLQGERNQSTGDEKLIAEAAHVRSENNRSRSLGLRGEHAVRSGEDGSKLKFFATSEGESEDGRLRFSLGQELTIAGTGTLELPDRGLLSIEYDATEALTLKASHEMAFDDDLRVNIFGLGAEIDIWDGGTLSFGTVTASGSAGSHTVGHGGLKQEVSMSEKKPPSASASSVRPPSPATLMPSDRSPRQACPIRDWMKASGR